MNIFRVIRKKTEGGERGQAMLLIALAFIGLVSFIGLAIDAGILFAHIGHLRRGVDAAALSAANQIRQGYSEAELETIVKTSAEELVLLNLPAGSPAELEVVVETCETENTTIPNCIIGGAKRKLARVEAALDVNLAFLPMIGWDHVKIRADAISEAASIDLVLVIDNSTSMAYDASCNDGLDDDGDGNADDCDRDTQYPWPGNNDPWAENPVACPGYGSLGNPPGPGDQCMDGATPFDVPDDYFRYPTVCNFYGNCAPFEEVRAAAGKLIDSMFAGYDKISLVTFNKFAGATTGDEGWNNERPTHLADLPLTLNLGSARTALTNMTVYPNMIAGNACSGWAGEGDPRNCMRTNHAAGLMLAGMEFESARAREEAVKVIVLLSDGLANAAYAPDPQPFGIPDFSTLAPWYCPEGWRREASPESSPPGDGSTRRADDYQKPLCTDGDPNTGYNGVTNLSVLDPDDAARRMADWIGCLPSSEGGDCAYGGGLGAVIFTIGLGDGVVNYGPNAPSGVVGEELLRYIARVGFNGKPEFTPNSQCWGFANGVSCGNYYFSPGAENLGPIFEEIADRIFTRLTH